LDENAKNIFLHIACFFKGRNEEYVKKILLYCGFHSDSGIEELKDKCLITQSFQGLLVMHDLLQEMGKEIVRLESPNEPGERSRLWFHEDVRHVLKENTVRLMLKILYNFHLLLFHNLSYYKNIIHKKIKNKKASRKILSFFFFWKKYSHTK
jgi:hypothetical protein